MKDLFIISMLLLLTLATGLLWAIRYMERSELSQTYDEINKALIRCESAAKVCTNKEAEARKACDAAKKYRDEAQAIHDCLKEMADKPPTIDLSKYIDHARPYYLKDGPTSQPFATEFAKAVAKCEDIAELKSMIESTPPTLDPQGRTGEMAKPEDCEKRGGF